jgi:hypothetical protein
VTVSETDRQLQLFRLPHGTEKLLVLKTLSKHLENVLLIISMAGPWLRFRGHLDNISNMLMVL